MPKSRVRVLILPGLFNSGSSHWQSRWEAMDSTFERVIQDDWNTPRCADWVARLDETVRPSPLQVVLVAHSSSCAMVAHWARIASAESLAKVRGALLVAPSDPEGPNYLVGPTGFAPVPLERLPFRSVVVASSDDIYVTLERAQSYATAWGSSFVNLGATGHINGDSGLGDWPDGYTLLADLTHHLS